MRKYLVNFVKSYPFGHKGFLHSDTFPVNTLTKYSPVSDITTLKITITETDGSYFGPWDVC